MERGSLSCAEWATRRTRQRKAPSMLTSGWLSNSAYCVVSARLGLDLVISTQHEPERSPCCLKENCIQLGDHSQDNNGRRTFCDCRDSFDGWLKTGRLFREPPASWIQ